MNETILIEKLIKIEALFAGAATEGERVSADRARQRILKRLQELLIQDPPVEYKFTFSDMWSRKVFVTLLRRYGLVPYRYYRQRYTTVMAKVPKRFLDETLWPEFQKINEELNSYLQEVTDRVVKKVLHEDISDAVVVEQPLKIGLDQNSISKNPISAQNEKPGMPSETHKTNSHKNKKKKKRKKKRRNP
ncbi:MAG: hypothetical protein SRB2_03061 [Desulfobacteraceae bacterium Eth-SRB2]|nr:MAG: hypothetical protein SRB2_03061 [Desulfobacteraceae bacterium Eth-SRB2]